MSSWLRGKGLIFSVPGVPLAVAGGFFMEPLGLALGILLLILDLFFVPREEYQDPLRALEKSSGSDKAIVTGLLLLTFLGPFFGGLSPVVLREWIRRHGVYGEGIIEQKNSLGILPHHEFKISYPIGTGKHFSGRSYWISKTFYNRSRVGQTLSIHYLPRRPQWFTLDNIFPENAVYYWILDLCFLSFAVWFAFRIALRF